MQSHLHRAFFAAATLIYIATFAYGAWQGITRPFMNWDMLPYMGSVLSWDGESAQAIYDKTMAAFKAVAQPWLYEKHTHNLLSNNSYHFVQQLPRYYIKPLYVAAVWFFYHLGAGLAQATWLVSTASFLMLGVVLASWRPQFLHCGVWLLAIVALCVWGEWGMATLPQLSTPDALAFLWFMLAFFSWYRSRPWAACFCALLAMLTRPDMLINILMLAVFFAYFREKEYQFKSAAAVCFAVIACVLSVVVQKWVGDYGWAKHFYYSFIQNLPDIAHTQINLTWPMYQDAVARGFSIEMHTPRLLVFMALSLVAGVAHYLKPDGQRQWCWLLGMVWSIWAARFLIFPAWGDERYYYPYYLLILLSSLELLGPLISRSK